MKKTISLLLSLALTLSLVACGSGDTGNNDDAVATPDASGAVSGTTEPAVGGSLTVGLNTAPVSANVWYQNDLNAAIIMNLVCPNPVTMDADGNKYNHMVESATSNDDATVWTVTIAEGLTWSDGEPVTADDLLFTALYGTEHHIGFFDSYYGVVDTEATSIIDERTVEFVLTSPSVNFWNGAGYWIPFMRQSEWETVDDPSTYNYSGVGYGPYYISEWVDGEYITLERNPYFTLANDGQGAYIDQVVFRIYTDENAMVLALQNGEIDTCANFLGASSVNQLSTDEKFLMSSVDSLGYALLSFSQKNELLTDFNVRKAIAMSVDREALVNVACAGAGIPMYTPVSPVYASFVESNITQPEFDIAGAAALLESAGYVDTDGDGIRESASGDPLSFVITYKSTLTNVDGIMSILSSSLAETGIELKLQPVDAATFSANVTVGHTYELSYNSWGTIDDVDTTLLTCFGIGQTLNFMEYNDEDQEVLLRAMQSETDYEARKALVDEWQAWFVNNLPTCHLFVPNNTYVTNTENFDGWSIAPGNYAYMDCAQFVNVYQK